MTWYLLLLLPLIVAEREPAGQNIIFILVDGFSSTLLNSSQSESSVGIKEMQEHGVQAEYLKPSFPTQTWPNYFTLVTGLYTENHGFTSDYMWDEKSGLAFERGQGVNDTEDLWWDGRPAPLWYTAGKHNVDIHCYWFAHCHRAYYDMVVQVPPKRAMDLSATGQTDKIGDIFPEMMKRITKYQGYKQQLFLIRYGELEEAQRLLGKNSDAVSWALRRFDTYLYDLQRNIEENKLETSTNVIVVSPHGLHSLEDEDQFFLEECLSDYSKIRKIVNSHSMMMVFTDPEDENNIHFELRVCDQWAPMGDYDENDTPAVKVHKISEFPDELHWKNSRFMSGVVLITKPGVSVITRELPSIPDVSNSQKELKMTSGWEPDHVSMRGIFLARGPAFKSGESYPPMDLVDVYQCVLNILGLEPPHAHNGTWDNVGRMMTEGWEERPNSDKFNSAAVISPIIVLFISLFF